uniref:Uncharacterized protein n=1 Tax=viral metagenome TaxID=1070528 RepID=A0A6C0CTK7_9ZZZZ
MATNSIILTKNLEVNKITYDEPKKLDNGGKMIYVSFKKNPLRIQTPQCYLPFGINVYKNEDSGTEAHTLELSFDGKDSKPNLMDFFVKMKEFDDLNIQKGFEYQQSWFRKKYPNKEVIEALYTTMIKYPKDKNGEITTAWPPTFKIKLPYVNGEYKFEMYDKSNLKIDPKSVQTKGGRAVAIIKCNGIWLAGGKFGMSWKAEQIQIIPPNKISGFCIRYVKEDMINQEESEEGTNDPTRETKDTGNETGNETSNETGNETSNNVPEKIVNEEETTKDELQSEDKLEPDSEDELEPDSEDELEPEPVPEPEPVKAKKKVVKKKTVTNP